MEQVFQAGDVVYHNVYAEGVVAHYTKTVVRVYFEKMEYQLCCTPQELSFEPWPAPNHERPMRDGRYCMSRIGGYDSVVIRKNGIFHYTQGGEPITRVHDGVVARSKFKYIGE